MAMNSSLVPLILCLLVSAPAARTLAGDEVVEILRAAQKTNHALVTRGRLEAKARTKITSQGEPVRTFEVEGTVVWSGDRTYWDCTLMEGLGPAPDGRRKYRMVETPELLTIYFPHTGLVQKVRDGKLGYHDEFKLRPDQAWFSYRAQRDWLDFLDPRIFSPENYRTTIREEEKGRIVLERTATKTGAKSRIVFSLEAGGNVVSFQGWPRSDGTGFTVSATYDWARHSGGAWYLRRHTYERARAPDPKDYRQVSTIEVTSFDPDPVIPPDQFEFSALRVRPGVRVEEHDRTGRRRVYRLGRERPFESLKLDQLAEQLRSKGFASPDRD